MSKRKIIKVVDLLRSGATIVDDLEYHYERPKASGAMWEGSMVLQKGNYTYYFKLWHHGGDTMSTREALDGLVLEGIKEEGGTSGPFKDSYYDLHWHSVRSPGSIWIHPEGWFGDKDLEKKLFRKSLGETTGNPDAVFEYHRNYNWQEAEDFTGDQKEKLRELGFKELPIEESKE